VCGRWKRMRERREIKLIKLNKCKWVRGGATSFARRIREISFAANSISQTNMSSVKHMFCISLYSIEIEYLKEMPLFSLYVYVE
jgi:hypothetical protein